MARLALRARRAARSAAAVDAALTDDRSLVAGWLMRGTLHLVATDDYAWLHALTAPLSAATNRRRLAQLGGDAEAAEPVIVRALAAEGPLARGALGERLAAAGIRVEGQILPHLLALAAARGQVVLGPVRDGRQCFALARDWLGAPERAPDRDAALAELARRYLRAHGPATDGDLASWSGLPLRDARAGMAAIAAELEQDGALVDLARRPAPPQRLPPRLLGAFDPYMLGWRERELRRGATSMPGGCIRAAASCGRRRSRTGASSAPGPRREGPSRSRRSPRSPPACRPRCGARRPPWSASTGSVRAHDRERSRRRSAAALGARRSRGPRALPAPRGDGRARRARRAGRPARRRGRPPAQRGAAGRAAAVRRRAARARERRPGRPRRPPPRAGAGAAGGAALDAHPGPARRRGGPRARRLALGRPVARGRRRAARRQRRPARPGRPASRRADAQRVRQGGPPRGALPARGGGRPRRRRARRRRWTRRPPRARCWCSTARRWTVRSPGRCGPRSPAAGAGTQDSGA